MPINYRLLRLEIDKQAGAIYAKAKPLIQQEFERKKADMLEAFDEHPVTQELEAGPEAEGSVPTEHGGNLYSLIGFNEGENPTGEVRKVLDESVRLNVSQTKRTVGANVIEFSTPVVVPTLDAVHERVAKRTDLGWTKRSFTEILERGITGFNRYLFKQEGFKEGVSRSGTAIEVKAPVRQGSMGKRRYISDILAGFRNAILGKRK